ncbi:hypothetical protein SNEBB_005966 [Seison nebaliae]|nr:hypothetical protein SNEBB_005966 [Seison nebaliae]
MFLIRNIRIISNHFRFHSTIPVFVEVYGCQMNVNDTEIIYSILHRSNFQNHIKLSKAKTSSDAQCLLINTCSIRDGAEQRIWNRLKSLQSRRSHNLTTIGILGCMAERLKNRLIESGLVDMVCGPDSYRTLPSFIRAAASKSQSPDELIDVKLSTDETYSDVIIDQISSNSKISRYLTIMRGCNNHCSFCIVPFVRGVERSLPFQSLIDQTINLIKNENCKEIILLGQNVNTYRYERDDLPKPISFRPSQKYESNKKAKEEFLSSNFSSNILLRYETISTSYRFAHLLETVAEIDPNVRIRFTSPHPKDFPDEVLQVMKRHRNICQSIHLPAQSGSNRILELMKRNYTKEIYLELVEHIRSILPDISFTSDFIAGFCDETEEDHQQTLDLIDKCRYRFVYSFPFSLREKTKAHRHLSDNVDFHTKRRRHEEICELWRRIATEENEKLIGMNRIVLVDGRAKRRKEDHVQGRIDEGVRCNLLHQVNGTMLKDGDYVMVKILSVSSQSVYGKPLELIQNL